MSFVSRSLPPEAEDPPPSELEQLVARVRRGIRSQHQQRILRRIAEITRVVLAAIEGKL